MDTIGVGWWVFGALLLCVWDVVAALISSKVARSRRPLSFIDGFLLRCETAAAPMRVLGVFAFRGAECPQERFWTTLQCRTRGFQRMRSRIVEDVEGKWWWEETPLDRKYNLVVLKNESGTEAERQRLINQTINEPLDLNKPLWRAVVIDGCNGGTSWTLVLVIHHIVGDGMALSRLTQRIMDFDPHKSPNDTTRTEEEYAMEEMPEKCISKSKVAATRGSWWGRVLGALSVPVHMVKFVAPLFAKAEPNTVLRASKPQGQMAMSLSTVGDVEELKRISKRLGTTITALLLSVTAGAIARFCEHHDGEWPGQLRAMVPSSNRKYTRDLPEGNSVGVFPLAVPTHLRDRLERIRAVEKQMARLRNPWFLAACIVDQALMALLWAVIPINALRRQYLRRTSFVFSSVMASPFPMYLAGCEVQQLIGAPPLLDGVQSSFAIVSSNGKLCASMICDIAVTPHPEEVTTLFASELAEYSKLAGGEVQQRL